MASATRSICCACLFIGVFFDAGYNHRTRRDLVSFAQHAVNKGWSSHLFNDDTQWSQQSQYKNNADTANSQRRYIHGRKLGKKKLRQLPDSKAGLVEDTNQRIEGDLNGDDMQKCSEVEASRSEGTGWPKFEEIMRLTNKYYDWKNDRWRKYRKLYKYGTREERKRFKSKTKEESESEKGRDSSLKSLGQKKILDYKTRKKVMAIRNFHFSRVRMEGGENDHNIVVAVSALTPRKG